MWNRRQAPGEAAVGVSGRNRSPWLTEDVWAEGVSGVSLEQRGLPAPQLPRAPARSPGESARLGSSLPGARRVRAQLTARKGGVQGAHPGGLDQRRELWGRNGPHPSCPFPPGPAPGPHPASWRLHGLLCQGETDAEELTRRRSGRRDVKKGERQRRDRAEEGPDPKGAGGRQTGTLEAGREGISRPGDRKAEKGDERPAGGRVPRQAQCLTPSSLHSHSHVFLDVSVCSPATVQG